MTLMPFPLRTPPAIFLFAVSLAAIGSGLESEPVRAADESGGWDAFQTGFATKARVAAGTPVTVSVLAMGNSRGIVVTYSGNPHRTAPGKLWNRNEVCQGMRYTYAIDDKLSNQQLAFRSGANPAGLDAPRRVERIGNAYKLSFASGRVVVVQVSPAN